MAQNHTANVTLTKNADKKKDKNTTLWAENDPVQVCKTKDIHSTEYLNMH